MTPLLPGAGARRVDRCVQHAGRSAANPPHAAAAVERWVRQTDGGTPDRYINAYCAANVNNSHRLPYFSSTISYVVFVRLQ